MRVQLQHKPLTARSAAQKIESQHRNQLSTAAKLVLAYRCHGNLTDQERATQLSTVPGTTCGLAGWISGLRELSTSFPNFQIPDLQEPSPAIRPLKGHPETQSEEKINRSSFKSPGMPRNPESPSHMKIQSLRRGSFQQPWVLLDLRDMCLGRGGGAYSGTLECGHALLTLCKDSQCTGALGALMLVS